MIESEFTVTQPLLLAPDVWTSEEQRIVFERLAGLLGIVPGGPPIEDLTDQELSVLFGKVAREMRDRESAVNVPAVQTKFLNDVVYTEVMEN